GWARAGPSRSRSRRRLPRLRLGRVGETMFPPRAPFFSYVRLGAHGNEVVVRAEDHWRGNLPVPPNPFHATAHAVAALPRYASITRSSCWISCGTPSAIFSP